MENKEPPKDHAVPLPRRTSASSGWRHGLSKRELEQLPALHTPRSALVMAIAASVFPLVAPLFPSIGTIFPIFTSWLGLIIVGALCGEETILLVKLVISGAVSSNKISKDYWITITFFVALLFISVTITVRYFNGSEPIDHPPSVDQISLSLYKEIEKHEKAGLSPKLLISKNGEGKAIFHFTMKNNGNSDAVIENILCRDSDGVSFTTDSLIDRDINPGSEIKIECISMIPIPFPANIDLTVAYKDGSSLVNERTGNYGFSAGKEDVFQPIDPISQVITDGAVSTNELANTVAVGFKKQEGTIEFLAPSSGFKAEYLKVNLFSQQRKFFFDSLTGRYLFLYPDKEGKPIGESGLIFGRSVNSFIVVIVTWSDIKRDYKVYIDGKPTK